MNDPDLQRIALFATVLGTSHPATQGALLAAARPQSEYVQPNGQPRVVRPVYMTSVPTRLGEYSVEQPRKPWEPRLRRSELPESDSADWTCHRRTEIGGIQYGLHANEAGRSEFKFTKMTDMDKRNRISSKHVADTTLTDEELASMGMLQHPPRRFYRHSKTTY